ncbi:MAG TPA: hypothetical protein VGC78_15820 [Gaiellaceae bacterium]|jgi:hypothetical protein
MIYRSLTQVTAVMMIALGIAMLVVTLSRGGGVGLVIGALFVAAGAGRLWLMRKGR